MRLYQLRPYQDARKGPTKKPSLWQRIRGWFSKPVKAEVFRYKNPTHWKLERIRRKARGTIELY